MSALQGQAFFPGIETIISANYTLSHGIQAGIATITMAPQNDPIGASGDLVFQYGSALLDFPNCRVSLGTLRLSDNGTTFTVQILDRRWMWKFGEISGHYNIRLADGSIDQDTQQTPQQLAQMLFQAMGEGYVDYSQLPNDSLPEVTWDHEVPAVGLEELCEQLGCVVVLQTDSLVAIRLKGFGNSLPTNGEMAIGFAVDPSEHPDTVKIVGGANLYQCRLTLEAVGAEDDGTVKLVNNLSYVPSNGWNSISNPDYLTEITDPVQRQVALRSVFRWYRITVHAEGGSATGNVPGYTGQISRRDQLLPIFDTLIELDSHNHPKKAYVVGQFYLNVGPLPTYQNTTQLTTYPGDFSIDTKQGIVEFSRPVYMLGQNNNFQFAQLQVCTSMNVQDVNLRIPVKFEYQVPVPGDQSGTGPEIDDHDDIVATFIANYDSSGNMQGVTDNSGDVNNYAQLYASAKIQSYADVDAADQEYAGLRDDIQLDGAIRQISYSVSLSGTTTKASMNSEHAILVPKVAELHRRERLNTLHRNQKKARKMVKQLRRLKIFPFH